MAETFSNAFTRRLNPLEKIPNPLRRWVRNYALGRAVPLVGTCKLDYVAITEHRVEIHLRNHYRIRNHLGQIHAGAMILLAESATGFVVGRNLPDTSVPLIKTITTHFRRRTLGNMRAVATLTDEQIAYIRSNEKGETLVPVVVTDESDQPPIECEMLWAWTSKKKIPGLA
jgi:acyl-coenzyme A thioesterase PaaI-like protein